MTYFSFKNAGLVAFILVALSWYGYKRTHTPPFALVNGTFSNACCGDLTLKDGFIEVGKTKVPFHLENMKFGLTAYPTHRLEIHGAEVAILSATDDGGISFSGDGSVLTLCGDTLCRKVYRFQRQ